MRVVIAFIILMLWPFASAARDPGGKYAQADPKMHEWFEHLKSGKGPCCADADGNVLKDSDWESQNKPGSHFRVYIEDQWVDVPDEAVITEPNLFGRTMVWPIGGYNEDGSKHITIRCFLPGALM